LEGATTLAAAVEEIRTRSRQFAKRQLTWFRHLQGCRAVEKMLTEGAWGSRI
jgi:tRNA dimethylallyltransferase